MTHLIELTPEMEDRLKKKAHKDGKDVDSYLKLLVERSLDGEDHPEADESNPAYLLSLPKAERDRILEAQVALAAPLYEADLALPVEERELTAFTSLNDDPILEDYHAS